MMSILQNEKKCYITGQAQGLHKHHIYPGYGTRQICEREGFYIWLKPEFHNMSNDGIHFNKEFDLEVKRECQRKYEETHTREEFVSLIGRNYL